MRLQAWALSFALLLGCGGPRVQLAFESYPYDLASTLRICITGFTMYPCESDPSHPDAVELRVDDR